MSANRYDIPGTINPDDPPRDWIVVAVHGPAIGNQRDISYDLEARAKFTTPRINGVQPHNRNPVNSHPTEGVDIYAAAIGTPAIPTFMGRHVQFSITEHEAATAVCE